MVRLPGGGGEEVKAQQSSSTLGLARLLDRVDAVFLTPLTGRRTVRCLHRSSPPLPVCLFLLLTRAPATPSTEEQVAEFKEGAFRARRAACANAGGAVPDWPWWPLRANESDTMAQHSRACGVGVGE